MSIKDNLIKKSKITNTDEKLLNNNCFDTEDYIYLESNDETKNLNAHEKLASATDYAIALGCWIFETKTKNGKHACCHWQRTASSNEKIKIINHNKNEILSEIFAYNSWAGICPALQFDLSKPISCYSNLGELNGFDFKIKTIKNDNEVLYHTISFEYLQYPQTKVGNAMHKELEQCFKSGKLTKTGKSYQGRLTDIGYEYNDEYFHEGNCYVRVKAFIRDKESFFSDFSTCETDDYIWIKVEPINWIIRNWSEMPKSINPNGNGNAKTIIVRSQEALLSGVPFYKNGYDENRTFWQNSTIRANLNGISVNNISQNGNLNFVASHGGDFTNHGFIDDIYIYEKIQSNAKIKKENHDPKILVTRVYKKTLREAGLDYLS